MREVEVVGCLECFDNYTHGAPSPWICPKCGTKWQVYDGQWRRIQNNTKGTGPLDNLAQMLHDQRFMQIGSFGLDPAEASVEERVEYVRWNVLALTDELHEMLAETGWKPWATDRFINEEAAFKELVDAWHFFMNIMWAVTGLGTMGDAQILADQFTDAYQEKRLRNVQRQLEGYTGSIGGAEHDAQHVEE